VKIEKSATSGLAGLGSELRDQDTRCGRPPGSHAGRTNLPLTGRAKSPHTAIRKIDRKIGIRGRSMAFAFGGAGALLKAFIPSLSALAVRRSDPAATPARTPLAVLSAEAEAALASLGLPPDGPIDPDATPRARLAPDVAARNFVRWAQALELDGDYATRSIYALYCEFSEVDGRPPLRDTRFLEALAETQGITTVARGKDKARRLWRWTIAPAKPIETVAEAIADVWSHVSAPGPDRAAEPAASPPDPDPALVPEGTAPAMPAARAPEVAVRDVDAGATAPAPPAAPADISKLAAPTIARAPKTSAPVVAQAPPAVARQPMPQPAAPKAPVAANSSAGAIAVASATAPARPARSAIVLPRFVPDADHPFSPAALREREKCARRLRLNAALSRKQRGALRRAA
jgi:hypothetical protein